MHKIDPLSSRSFGSKITQIKKATKGMPYFVNDVKPDMKWCEALSGFSKSEKQRSTFDGDVHFS